MDTQLIRDQAGNNIWPKTLLEKYYPLGNPFDGDEGKMSPILYEMYGFMMDTAYVGKDATMDSTILQVTTMQIESLCLDLMTVSAKYLASNVLRGESRPMTRYQTISRKLQLMAALSIRAGTVEREKEQNKTPRPPTYKGELDEYTPSYSTPSLSACLLAITAKLTVELFEIPEEKYSEVLGAAYTTAMLWPMAGLNTIDSVVDAFNRHWHNLPIES